ncbi:MAG: PAS domain S-box protein [Bacteroidales bacterium]|nr:PAS domain S-box protein [Bacteroidales bacterium]
MKKKFIYIFKENLSLCILLLIVFIILINFLFSDYLIDRVIQDTELWYQVQQIRWFLMPIILILFSIIILTPFFIKYNNIKNKYNFIYSNYLQAIDNLIQDYFFYRHEKNKPFVYISASVSNILGYSKTDFINLYEKIGAAELFNERFEKLKESISHNLPISTYEVIIIDKYNNPKHFEIREFPRFNEKGEIIEIEGIAKDITKHKNYEIELKEKEKLYQIIFQNATDGLILLKGERFIDCNKKVLEIYKCNLEEFLLYTPFHYRFSPQYQPNGKSSKELALEYINNAYKGNVQKFEWVHLREGKYEFYTEITLNKFTYENEDFLLAIVRDITEEKRILQQIKNNEHYINSILQNIPYGIIVYTKNFKIKVFNDNIISLLKVNQISQISFFTNYLMQDINKINNTYITIENPYNKEILQLYVTINLLSEEQNNDIIVIVEDFREKNKMLEEIIKQKNTLDEIFNNSRQVLYKFNLSNQKYEYVSNSIFLLTGYTPEEFMNLNPEEMLSLVHPEDVKNNNFIISKMIDINKLPTELTCKYRIKNKNGIYHTVSDKIKIVQHNNEKFIIGEIIDLTALCNE